MKRIETHWKAAAGVFVAAAMVMATVLTAISQSVPVVSIAPAGTNTFNITITNGMAGANYEVWWTPALANPDYPWTTLAVGTPGQTNFNLNMGIYQSGFFEGVLDTNAIPLWEAANPTNSSLGVLTVLIDSPTNGAVLQ
jgi:hypothetical protein